MQVEKMRKTVCEESFESKGLTHLLGVVVVLLDCMTYLVTKEKKQ